MTCGATCGTTSTSVSVSTHHGHCGPGQFHPTPSLQRRHPASSDDTGAPSLHRLSTPVVSQPPPSTLWLVDVAVPQSEFLRRLNLAATFSFNVKLDLNFSLVLRDTLHTFLLLFSTRSTMRCSLLIRCLLLRKILFELRSQCCLLFVGILFMIMCLNWMISLVSCGIGVVLSLLNICLLLRKIPFAVGLQTLQLK